MEKKLIIVGAGVAGLAAGIYARQSGFNTSIIESHSIPGGNCTSWRRKGYLFEGAIHWLTGSSPNNADNFLWRETGALNDTVYIYNNDPYQYTEYEGVKLYLYRNLNRLKEHFLQVSPEDSGEIEKLCKAVKIYSVLKMPVENEKGLKIKKNAPEPSKSQMGIRDIFSMLPALIRMNKDMKISIEDYVKRFKHRGIQRILLSACPPDFPVMALVFFLATMSGNDGGYPEGGSLAMIERMADVFKSLGGELLLNTKVQKIIIENNVIKGVNIGEKKIEADCVILANDTITAVDTLFDIPIEDAWIKELKAGIKEACVCTFAGIGVKSDLSNLPHSIVINLEKPLEIAGEKLWYISLNNYAEHTTYAPEGCTALTAILGNGDTYNWWKDAKKQGTYNREKEDIKVQLEKILAVHIPETKGKIDVIDIATPLTYERYTGTWHGSYMSRMTVGSKFKTYPCNLKNIKGLFFAGQRTKSPGGLPPALESGRRAAQLLCKEYDIFFQNNT
jgi:phytoene dehydrogenase-like protein